MKKKLLMFISFLSLYAGSMMPSAPKGSVPGGPLSPEEEESYLRNRLQNEHWERFKLAPSKKNVYGLQTRDQYFKENKHSYYMVHNSSNTDVILTFDYINPKRASFYQKHPQQMTGMPAPRQETMISDPNYTRAVLSILPPSKYELVGIHAKTARGEPVQSYLTSLDDTQSAFLSTGGAYISIENSKDNRPVVLMRNYYEEGDEKLTPVQIENLRSKYLKK